MLFRPHLVTPLSTSRAFRVCEVFVKRFEVLTITDNFTFYP